MTAEVVLCSLTESLLDGSDHPETLLRHVVVLPAQQRLEVPDRISEPDIFPRNIGVGFGDHKGLCEKLLDALPTLLPITANNMSSPPFNKLFCSFVSSATYYE